MALAQRLLSIPGRLWKHSVLCALAFSTTPLLEASAAFAQTKKSPPVVYAGRLEDLNGRPVGGIYPLTFSFYRSENAKSPIWSETHYVAIDNGIYALELGRLKALPKNTDLSKLWLGVSSGKSELLREPFANKGQGNGLQQVSPSAGAPVQNAQGTYADLAGSALEAEKAKTAENVGGLTATDIKGLITKAVAAQPAATPASKPKLGAATRFSDPVGGQGGDAFTISCPPGHVVTGIKGRGAALIDQIQLICSPLE